MLSTDEERLIVDLDHLRRYSREYTEKLGSNLLKVHNLSVFHVCLFLDLLLTSAYAVQPSAKSHGIFTRL